MKQFTVIAFNANTGAFLFSKVVTGEDKAEALATAWWHPETDVLTTWEPIL